MWGHRFLICCLSLLSFIAATPAGADDAPLARVGRVSAADGALSIRPAGGEWTDSGVNAPVTAGMSARAAPLGRAVLRAGSETIALAGATELDLAQLDAAGTQIVLRRGRIAVRLSDLDPAHSIEIDIPRGGVWVLTPGDYDIVAGDDRTPARIAVLSGRARVVGKGLDTTIATGSANLLSGSDPVVASLDGAAADDFAIWWRAAAGPDGDTQPLRYVSAAMTGYEALGGNGSWETVAGYGAVWFPSAAADAWGPYRNGHWRWIAPWGWSWIDDMPWAFAPTHYGRWARIPQPDPLDLSGPGSERWGWVPGKLVAHPVYAPALVAFLGTAGVGLSYPDAFGPAVAWFPLAPGEAYWPAYTSDLNAIRRINEAAVADVSTIAAASDGEPPAAIVNGDYQNRRFATAVPRAVFTAGRPVAPALVRLPARRLDNAPLLTGSPQIAPPAPRFANATSPGAANLAASAATTPRLVSAMRTLGRILAPRNAGAARIATPRAANLAVAGHSRWPNTHVSRPRLIAAVATHPGPSRLRLAAAHRAR
jgi:hypothetical protein